MDQIYYQQDISNEVFVQRFTKQGFYLYMYLKIWLFPFLQISLFPFSLKWFINLLLLIPVVSSCCYDTNCIITVCYHLLLGKLYKNVDRVEERHRHRYEVIVCINSSGFYLSWLLLSYRSIPTMLRSLSHKIYNLLVKMKYRSKNGNVRIKR